jgi:hypothetical protein
MVTTPPTAIASTERGRKIAGVDSLGARCREDRHPLGRAPGMLSLL